MDDPAIHLLVVTLSETKGSTTSYDTRCRLIGRNPAEWEEYPLLTKSRAHLPYRLLKSRVYQNEEVRLSVRNPYTVPAQMHIWYGAGRHKVTPLEPSVDPSVDNTQTLPPIYPVTVALDPMDGDCIGYCSLHVLVEANAPPTGTLTGDPDGATSIFHPMAHDGPLHTYARISLVVEADPVHLTIPQVETAYKRSDQQPLKSENGVVESSQPGQRFKLDVAVTPQPGADPSGAVVVMIVDQAFLDILPQHPRDLAIEFQPALPDPMHSVWTSLTTSAPFNLMKSNNDILLQRMTNPYLQLTWPTTAEDDPHNTLRRPIDWSDYEARLTNFPHVVQSTNYERFESDFSAADGAGAVFKSTTTQPAPPASPSAMDDSAEGGESTARAKRSPADENSSPAEASESAPPPLRVLGEPLKAFEVATFSGGTSTVSFDLPVPSKLGMYSVKIFTVSASTHEDGKKKMAFDSKEEKMRVSLDAGLAKYVPRFMRWGDFAEFGVILTIKEQLVGESFTVTLDSYSTDLLSVSSASSGSAPPNSQELTPSTTTTRVTFPFEAKAIGDAILTFSLKGPNGLNDRLEVKLEILAPQQAVTAGSTLALSAEEMSEDSRVEVTEGLSLPRVIPGIGGVSVVASVGYRATLLEIARRIIKNDSGRYYGGDVLSVEFVRHLLGTSYETDTATLDSLRIPEAPLKEYICMYSASCQARRLGFLPFPWTTYSSWSREYIQLDLRLTAAAIFVGTRVENAELKEAVPTLRSDLANRVVQRHRDYEEYVSRKKNGAAMSFVEYVGVETVTLLHFVLGRDAKEVKELLPWAAVAKHLPEEGEAAALAALLTYLEEEELDADGLRLAQYGFDNFRIQGPVGYIAVAKGSPHPAGDATQALLLQLMAYGGDAAVAHQFIPRLAFYLGAGGSSARWAGGMGVVPVLLGSLAMTEIDRLTNSDRPELSVQVGTRAEKSAFLDIQFTETQLGPVYARKKWTETFEPDAEGLIESDKILYNAKGSGTVFITTSLQFCPVPSSAFGTAPSYKGFLVEKRYLNGETCRGDPLKELHSGEVVCVAVTVTVKDSVSGVTVLDLAPAGLEPIDTAESYFPGGFNRRWFWMPICQRETKKDQVVFSCSYLPPGEHSFSYKANVNVHGLFAAPPAQAFLQNSPEVMGLSAKRIVPVMPRGQFTADQKKKIPIFLKYQQIPAALTAGVEVSAPVACASECPSNGVCDVGKGECFCPDEFQEMVPCGNLVASIEIPTEGFSMIMKEPTKKKDEEDDNVDSSTSQVRTYAIFHACLYFFSMLWDWLA